MEHGDEGGFDASDIINRVEKKSKEFSELINSIEFAPDEIKVLWKEIYWNALEDRTNAYVLFTDLYRSVANSQQGHMNHGVLMTKYLERMNKANDQLLKLSEMVEKMVRQDHEIDKNALYEEFAKE